MFREHAATRGVRANMPRRPLTNRGIVFDIRLSQEQREFRDLARKFAQEEIKPKAMALDLEPEWEKRVPWDLRAPVKPAKCCE